jgi:hypothetical protein
MGKGHTSTTEQLQGILGHRDTFKGVATGSNRILKSVGSVIAIILPWRTERFSIVGQAYINMQ